MARRLPHRPLRSLAADPHETRDVKHLFPDDYQKPSPTASTAWTAHLPTSGGDERSEEELEALRALGYVQ